MISDGVHKRVDSAFKEIQELKTSREFTYGNWRVRTKCYVRMENN